jgi:hypothetical protein
MEFYEISKERGIRNLEKLHLKKYNDIKLKLHLKKYNDIKLKLQDF